MSLQILETVKTPLYVSSIILVALVYSVVLSYLDQFIFFAPYFVVYVPLTKAQNFIIDIALAILTGFVLVGSVAQIKSRGNRSNKAVRTGILGALAAIFAGACPCYYLVPLLAAAGSVGGALGAAGILLNAYQIPIKLASLTALVFVGYGLERSFRGQCMIPGSRTEGGFAKNPKPQ